MHLVKLAKAGIVKAAAANRNALDCWLIHDATISRTVLQDIGVTIRCAIEQTHVTHITITLRDSTFGVLDDLPASLGRIHRCQPVLYNLLLALHKKAETLSSALTLYRPLHGRHE